MKINYNVMVKVEAQPISSYQNRLILVMDLERNQLRFSFTHPMAQSVSSGVDFRVINLSMNTKDIPFLDKINLHRQTWELI